MFQILEMREGANRWTFVAHGARYSLDEAEKMAHLIQANGKRAWLVEIPQN